MQETTEITHCDGEGCKAKEQCLRYTTEEKPMMMNGHTPCVMVVVNLASQDHKSKQLPPRGYRGQFMSIKEAQ